MSNPPTFNSPEEFAEQLESGMLHCRELGHSWGHYVASYDARSKTYDRTLRCTSCGCERHQILDADGYIVTNGGYKYEPGYLAHSNLTGYVGGKIGRQVFRRASLERATGGGKVSSIKRRRRAS